MASLLYYGTYKYVVLKDPMLGILYYLLVGFIILYTVVEIFIRKGYLEFDTRPQGTVKLTLSDDLANEAFTSGDLPYCHGNITCKYLDPWDLNWPHESRAVTITTFGKDRIQQRSNTSNSPQDKYLTVEESQYFTQGPEQIVIKVDHSVVATQFTDSLGRETLAASHRQLRGYLVDIDGDIVRELCAAQLGKPDKVTIHELLVAAGVVDLDLKSDTVNSKDRSFRERGLILRVTISYQNWYKTWIGTSDVEYRYSVRRIPFVDYSTKHVEPLISAEDIISSVGTHTSEWRLLRKRYSIRVEFEQAGSLGMFSLSTLLLKLVSGMGLLTLSATVIDLLALYVLPDRLSYRSRVYGEPQAVKQSSAKQKDN